ncbi:RPEL repeat protein [Ceratobasidium sp. AG-Ba]|nr:RPEL repeat protein [Ceratobasidium sp. AG-Ba]
MSAVIDAVKSVVPGLESKPEENSTPENKPDETPLSPRTAEAKLELEKRLKERPEKKELVDRNILKDSTAAPALQAAQDRLQRAQLENKLEHALQARPKPEELVKDGILNKDEVPAQ